MTKTVEMGQEKDKVKGLDHEKEKENRKREKDKNHRKRGNKGDHNMIQYLLVTESAARLYF